MKKTELKQLIKESVREVLLTEGFLSTIVAEVVKGVGTNIVTESSVENKPPEDKVKYQEIRAREKKTRFQETKRKMLEAIGKDAYGGIDIFEGTTPMRAGGSTDAPAVPNSALGHVEPSDPGVDISSLMGASDAWKQMIK
jgi:hypothetical protein